MSGHKIVEGLKEAIAGNLSRVTVDGQVWVLEAVAQKPVGCIRPAGAEAGCHGLACPRRVPYGYVLPQTIVG